MMSSISSLLSSSDYIHFEKKLSCQHTKIKTIHILILMYVLIRSYLELSRLPPAGRNITHYSCLAIFDSFANCVVRWLWYMYAKSILMKFWKWLVYYTRGVNEETNHETWQETTINSVLIYLFIQYLFITCWWDKYSQPLGLHRFSCPHHHTYYIM